MSTIRLTYFPYEKPTHDQQKIFASILNHQASLINLPTGTGKTIASLASLLEAWNPSEKIFIFVHTINQIDPILREWSRIRKIHPHLRILPYLGRGIQCGSECFQNHKKKTIHHKRNWKRQLKRLNYSMEKNPVVTEFFSLTHSRKECSREFIEYLLPYADIIITTHPYLRNHYFTKLLRLCKVSLENSIILVDEAHNLTQGIEYAFMSQNDLKFWLTVLPQNSLLHNMYSLSTKPFSPIQSLQSQNPRPLIKLLQSRRFDSLRERADNFVKFLELLDWGYLGYDFEKGYILIGSTPYKYLNKFKSAKKQAYQSATFYDVAIMKKLFGLPKDIGTAERDFFYKPLGTQLRLYLTTTTSLKRGRNKYSYTRMADLIQRFSRISPRHILVLFPSYEYITAILPYFPKDFLRQCLIEYEDTVPGDLLSPLFTEYFPRIIFANQRGKIMEGVEWVKDGHSLVSLVIMAGMATFVPSEDTYIEPILKYSYTELGIPRKVANEYIYLYPLYLIGKQAFGRAIRSQRDRAAFILLDYRAERYLVKRLTLGWGVSPEHTEKRLEAFFADYPKLSTLTDPLDQYF